MNKSVKYLVAAGLVAATASMSAQASPGEGKHEARKAARFFKKFDLNHDGRVSLREFRRVTGGRFDQMDANKDGKVSVDELIKYARAKRTERRNRIMARIDSNKDGVISKKEFVAFRMKNLDRQFSRLDKDGNGSISSDELAHRGRGKRSRKGRKHHGRKHHGMKRRMFRRMDRNRDGLVSRRENQRAWIRWFRRADLNGDEVITEKELAEARMRRHARRHRD
jgi:Ca2+-binding EF-hand superfamily protein